jgi:ABC-type hemin transport system substrate-binding protein
MNSIQLREKRAALVNEMNHIVAAAQTEGRSLNAEENQKFDAIENDVRSLGESAEKIERAEQMKKEIAAVVKHAPNKRRSPSTKRFQSTSVTDLVR